MQPGKEILDELRGLSSYLATVNRVVPFTVPDGYFDRIPAAMLQGVLAADSDMDITLSAARTNPYQVPQGYFDALSDSVLSLVLEEKELSFLPKASIIAVPEGYFDTLPQRMLAAAKAEEKPATKVIPLGNTLWKNLRWAAAAGLIAGIGFGGYRMMRPNVATHVTATASVEQRLAQMPDATINHYIQQNIDDFDGDMIASVVVKNETKTPVTKDQLTNKEIIDYLDETGWETSL
ncbi:MAG: hypothetical protein EOP51_09985 [Sphingobacteriales bacterium]|nr:MAG: hypothetical protein EOP51_09985 [Sphingobacteriales bacterium]